MLSSCKTLLCGNRSNARPRPISQYLTSSTWCGKWYTEAKPHTGETDHLQQYNNLDSNKSLQRLLLRVFGPKAVEQSSQYHRTLSGGGFSSLTQARWNCAKHQQAMPYQNIAVLTHSLGQCALSHWIIWITQRKFKWEFFRKVTLYTTIGGRTSPKETSLQ